MQTLSAKRVIVMENNTKHKSPDRDNISVENHKIISQTIVPLERNIPFQRNYDYLYQNIATDILFLRSILFFLLAVFTNKNN